MSPFRHNLFFILFLYAFSFKAQFDGLRNHNVDDGLPGSDLYKVLQDSKGYIWTTGDMGISRFDGYTFKNYTTANGLPENTVLNVYEDKTGKIWFCSISGKLCYYQNDSIHALSCNNKLSELFKYALATSLYVDQRGDIWLGCDSSFVIKVPAKSNGNDIEKIRLKGPYIYQVSENGLLFGGTFEFKIESIYLYNSKNTITDTIKTGIKNQEKKRLRYYVSQLKDRSYLITFDTKTIHYDGNLTQNKGFDRIIINYAEGKDFILLCTFKGTYFVSKKGFGILRETKRLKNKIVTCAIIDHEDGIWMTTEGHGLFYIPYCNIKYYTPENGIPESKISCISVIDSMVAIGNRGNQIVLLHDTIIKPINFPVVTQSTGSSRINSILPLKNRTLITGSTNSFLFINKKPKPILFEKFIGSKQVINSADDNIWSIGHFQLLKLSIEKKPELLLSVPLKTRADHIFEDSEGRVWLSAVDGVYTYYQSKLTKVETQNKLFSNRAVVIAETKDKKIWIATKGAGVIIKSGNVITNFTEANGLAGDMILSLYPDSGCVWVGTNKGLSKIKANANDNYQIENYYVNNGLLNNEVNNIIKHEGKIWLVHNNSITVFDPALIKVNKVAPKVHILQTYMNDSVVAQERLNELRHNENNLEINYIGLAFKDVNHPEYKYKIEGLNPDWVYTKYTSVRYNAIPAGSYTFCVYAKNNDGVWSDQPAMISFTILPAWWETWWFILICVVLSALVVGFLFKTRLDNIRKKELEREMLLHKISAVELEALRSQMNPHFVFNAINSVQYFITSNDPESSQKYLEKFASLIRYVLDNSKLTPIPLKTEINALNLYLELEALRFKFNYKIIVDENCSVNDIYVPSMLIQPYVENSIWHGLMHKKGPGEIIVSFELNGSLLKCTIEDNGIGRKKAAEIKTDSGKIKTHKSVGMSITKERLDIINKINDTNLTITITDLENELNESTGTRVEIDIPLTNL